VILITAPALAQNASQVGAWAAPLAANNMATAQVAIGQVATRLVAARAGRLLLQVGCSFPAFIGASSSVTLVTGFLLPNTPAIAGGLPFAATFNNYAGAMYAIIPAAAGNGHSCNVLEIY
jgi:hypothetical protein